MVKPSFGMMGVGVQTGDVKPRQRSAVPRAARLQQAVSHVVQCREQVMRRPAEHAAAPAGEQLFGIRPISCDPCDAGLDLLHTAAHQVKLLCKLLRVVGVGLGLPDQARSAS
jgi:hypothetical protein